MGGWAGPIALASILLAAALIVEIAARRRGRK